MNSIRHIPVDLIAPGRHQARRCFDAKALADLAESVKASGIVQPLVLRSRDGGYELLAGERRWRAAQMAGLHEVPALVRDDLSEDEAFVLGLIENLQRESLNPMETAAGLRRLGEIFHLTHEKIGQRIGKSREYVTNYLRLMQLALPAQRYLNEARISLGHAKVLLALDSEGQAYWAQQAAESGLSVRAMERQLAASARRSEPLAKKSADWLRLERELSDQLGYPAELMSSPDGRGELRLRFHSLDELDGLLTRLGHKQRS